MTITIWPTTKLVEINDVPARVWEGVTGKGARCHLYVTRIGVAEGEDQEEFQRDLQKQRAPSPELEAIPLRMIL